VLDAPTAANNVPVARREPKPKLDDRISELYALALDEFTAARDALAKELRDQGEREAATEVKKLRKPNQAAWAINQAVRADPDAAGKLVNAGGRLGDAQAGALEGAGAAELREAMAGMQEAVARMMAAVERAAGDAGGTATLDRARETLRAVASDEELREQFEAGRLTRDREAVGFGAAATAPKRGGTKPGRKQGRKAAPKRAAGESARLRDAETKARKTQRAAEAAGRKVEAARSQRDKAQAALEDTQQRLERAEAELAEREAELADARAVVAELSDG
jgi:hypothetical protein